MPGAHFTTGTPSLANGVIPLRGTRWHSGWSVAVNVVAVPGAFLVALAIALWRSRVVAALVVLCTLVETLIKHTLDRPALQHGARHIVAFDSSFPSGHSLRIVLVTTVIARGWAALWAVAAIVLLELAGWHTPTDIAGGVLLAALALLGARRLRGRRLPRRRA
jgi:membrane-associated phospholipid phosphatase